MGRGRSAWMLAVCLVVSACGSTSPSPAEPSESGERTGPGPGDDPATPPATSTPPGAGVPPTGPGDEGGTVSGLEGEPSLPPRACIPWTRPTPPVRATACASFSVFADGSSVRARYDADSNPLEVREFTSDGALRAVETRVWSGGLERLFRREEHSGLWFTQSEWTYDGRRLMARVDSNSYMDLTMYDYVYDAQGRIERVVRQWSGESVTSLYTYDAQGRLVRIADEQSDWLCGSGDSRCATLSYWPHGVLKRHEWETGKMNFMEEFDAAGRLIRSLAQDPDHLRRRQLGYDEAGRLSREWRLHSWYVWDATSVTRTVYDPAGRRGGGVWGGGWRTTANVWPFCRIASRSGATCTSPAAPPSSVARRSSRSTSGTATRTAWWMPRARTSAMTRAGWCTRCTRVRRGWMTGPCCATSPMRVTPPAPLRHRWSSRRPRWALLCGRRGRCVSKRSPVPCRHVV